MRFHVLAGGFESIFAIAEEFLESDLDVLLFHLPDVFGRKSEIRNGKMDLDISLKGFTYGIGNT